MTEPVTPPFPHNLGPADWAGLAAERVARDQRCVAVFVARHYGSTPRDQGSWMVISADESLGTLGGGEVERVVEAAARDMLADRRPWTRVYEKFMLGPDMGQCCGGGMEVLFEPVDTSSSAWLCEAATCVGQGEPGFVVFSWSDPSRRPFVHRATLSENMNAADGVHIQSLQDARPSVVIYGSGHVARAFAGIAAYLPIRLVLVDDRRIELARVPKAANIDTVFMEYPLAHAAALDASTAAVVVMTYSHALDYRLCLALLKKPDLAYIGLIGSKSKGARFRRRFAKDDGLSAAEIVRLVCPIGQGALGGKQPGVIALAGLNEIMAALESSKARDHLQANETNHV